jgi:hypothetical protein
MGYIWKESEIRYMVLVGKSEGNKQSEGQRRMWEDNIKMYIKQTKWKRLEWVILIQDRDNLLALVNMAARVWVR